MGNFCIARASWVDIFSYQIDPCDSPGLVPSPSTQIYETWQVRRYPRVPCWALLSSFIPPEGIYTMAKIWNLRNPIWVFWKQVFCTFYASCVRCQYVILCVLGLVHRLWQKFGKQLKGGQCLSGLKMSIPCLITLPKPMMKHWYIYHCLKLYNSVYVDINYAKFGLHSTFPRSCEVSYWPNMNILYMP